MNIQAMLLPHKHVRFGSSLIAIAGYVREFIHEPRTVDEIWTLINNNKANNLIKPTFSQLVLAVDILFTIGVAASGEDGRISLVQNNIKFLDKAKRGKAT